ncbi:MAG TPA: hypothetical protein VFB51_14015 [Solirubrobacterales bacterium]|nr:hypothetical protein [Solirubrobacterales bacterium]
MATTNSNASRTQRSAAAKRGQATRKRTTSNTAAARAQRSAAGKRGEATRRRQAARSRTTAAQRTVRAAASQRVAAETKQAESVLTQVGGVAESALLVPVGAALEVRDRVVGVIQPWTSRPSAEKELNRVRRDVRRFERRGSVARNRVLRELRKRRNSTARVVRKRRNEAARFLRLQRKDAQRTIKTNGKHAQARTARFRSELEKAVKPQVDRVQKELQTQTKQARDRVQQFV